jgi:hypothetical protein
MDRNSGPSAEASQASTHTATRKISNTSLAIGKPTTLGKIERWFRTYDLEHARFPLHWKFIQYYNYKRSHMALDYSTPAEAYLDNVPNVMGQHNQSLLLIL